MATGERSFAYSVVIPTKDRGPVVFETVRRLGAQRVRPERIFVVDATTPPLEAPEGLHDELRESGIELVLVHSAPSTAGQRNYGVDHAETPLVLFLDDDVQLPPDYVEVLLDEWRQRGFDSLSGAIGGASGEPWSTSPAQRTFRRLFMLHMQDPAARAPHFRASQKVRFDVESDETSLIDAASTMAVLYRTDLARKHRFDERFGGYVLGEDLDFASRIAREAPILYVPRVRFRHLREEGERGSPNRWSHRGRREAYFRLRRLERSPRARAAFAVSIVGEVIGAASESVRDREPRYVPQFLGGVVEAVRDVRRERAAEIRPGRVAPGALGRAYRRRVASASTRTDWTGLRILGYRRVTGEFRRQLEWLLGQDLRAVRLDAALDLLAQPIDERRFAITLDDASRDAVELALPILQELGVPATIYVPTAIVDRLADHHSYDPAPPTWGELEDVVRGGLVDVQSHGRRHLALPRLDEEQARAEVAGSKQDLELRLPGEVTSFAYPGGRYGPREIGLVADAGYRAALTCRAGVNPGGEPLYELKRSMVDARETFADFRARVAGAFDESVPRGLARSARGR